MGLGARGRTDGAQARDDTVQGRNSRLGILRAQQQLSAGEVPVHPGERDAHLAIQQWEEIFVEVDAESECRKCPERVQRTHDLLALRHRAGCLLGILERPPHAEHDGLGDGVRRHPVDEARRLATQSEAGRCRRGCRHGVERCAATQPETIGLGHERGAGGAER